MCIILLTRYTSSNLPQATSNNETPTACNHHLHNNAFCFHLSTIHVLVAARATVILHTLCVTRIAGLIGAQDNTTRAVKRWQPAGSAEFIILRSSFWTSEAIFTVRLHVMQRTVLLSEFCLSVCPSVCQSVRPSDACIVTKLNNTLRIFWYHTKRQSL